MARKKIKGFDKYWIYDDGKVFSEYIDKFMSPRMAAKGYKKVSLYKNKTYKDYYVHRLVAEYFLEKSFNKNYVNHKNGIKTDNRVENLEWCTLKENSRHMVDVLKKGTCENHSQAKLNNKKVIEIRKRLKLGEKIKFLANEFGVYHSVIYKIKKNEIWRGI